MKTVEEIVKGLRLCSEKSHCQDCAYLDGLSCDELYLDSQRTIERLIDENRALKTELQVNGGGCFVEDNKTLPDQTAKQDNGKLDPTLVPTEIIWAIAAVRREGVKKYKNPFNYRRVEKERLRAAAFRHFLKYLKDPSRPDEETGLPNLWHCCTNLAFLCEMEGWENGEVR